MQKKGKFLERRKTTRKSDPWFLRHIWETQILCGSLARPAEFRLSFPISASGTILLIAAWKIVDLTCYLLYYIIQVVVLENKDSPVYDLMMFHSVTSLSLAFITTRRDEINCNTTLQQILRCDILDPDFPGVWDLGFLECNFQAMLCCPQL